MPLLDGAMCSLYTLSAEAVGLLTLFRPAAGFAASFESCVSGVPGGIRTHDPLLRRQLLYPLSYRDDAAVVACDFITTIRALASECTHSLPSSALYYIRRYSVCATEYISYRLLPIV